MSNKLTDNEIIKALDALLHKINGATRIIIPQKSIEELYVVLKNALDLFNRLQAENERLEKENQVLQDQCDYWRTEAKTTRLELIQAPKKAYKEFAERLKEKPTQYFYETNRDMTIPLVSFDRIDNLLKELVGDSQ